ncbi:hypothetical protein EW146_g1538 [Bondarzewia mesenterica]|uniref:BHLH domain-containing protein n=1 Tax=Bondarzewia mesenterica TaxID=1095465 RepID=A0A4V3XG17_9AGAM|nr:hypothetical protein EW146_g1538 [Bondarzewia mesenterica]
MDPSQHHHHHIDDHSALAAGASYGFYPEEDQYNLVYPPAGLPPYQQQLAQSAPPSRGYQPPIPPQHVPRVDLNSDHIHLFPGQLSNTELQQAFQMRGLGLMPNANPYPNHQVYSSSPQHVPLSLSHSPPPASPNMYDPLSPPISGSDTSADGIYPSRNSSGTGSPSSSRANSLVHRNPLRYNPTPSPSGSSGRRSRGRSFNDSDEDMGVSLAESIAHTRKEATRRQRIEAEQRRRDELRDGYARLKDVLPVSNQKSSKVSLLERATNHIVSLEKTNRQLQDRLAAVEAEVMRLRSLNEKISLGTPSPMSMGADMRPLSPPPETSAPGHSLTSVSGQQPPHEDSSPSPSEGGDAPTFRSPFLVDGIGVGGSCTAPCVAFHDNPLSPVSDRRLSLAGPTTRRRGLALGSAYHPRWRSLRSLLIAISRILSIGASIVSRTEKAKFQVDYAHIVPCLLSLSVIGH